jgi:hypothetical protein
VKEEDSKVMRAETPTILRSTPKEVVSQARAGATPRVTRIQEIRHLSVKPGNYIEIQM